MKVGCPEKSRDCLEDFGCDRGGGRVSGRSQDGSRRLGFNSVVSERYEQTDYGGDCWIIGYVMCETNKKTLTSIWVGWGW